ncbi:MAG: Trk family potassium uptake protein, partial [Lentisphaeria bacterium]|nr:Trk family potassium uptake protein [Lentisphaeria bacterium]
AGGIKTTTLAVLALTFRSALNNSDSVIADQHRIAVRNIVQAAAIFMAAAMVLTAEILLLVTTQNISVKQLVFESVSALATAGLSLNTTGNLDSIGKVAVMAAMFAGRIGPLTLFLLLSERHREKLPGYPEITIPLG